MDDNEVQALRLAAKVGGSDAQMKLAGSILWAKQLEGLLRVDNKHLNPKIVTCPVLWHSTGVLSYFTELPPVDSQLTILSLKVTNYFRQIESVPKQVYKA